jgi:hypothetical protein
MKKIILAFMGIMMAMENFFTKKEGILWEFIEDIDERYGKFKNVATGKISTLEKIDFIFRENHYYEFEPKQILVGFGYLGTPIVHHQTWKHISYP